MERLYRSSFLMVFLLISLSSCRKKNSTLKIENEINLGNVSFEDTVKTNLRIVNTMDEDLMIKNTSSSCGCTVLTIKDSLVKPQDSINLEIIFIPKNSGVKGLVSKVVVIETNSKERFHDVTINANVK